MFFTFLYKHSRNKSKNNYISWRNFNRMVYHLLFEFFFFSQIFKIQTSILCTSSPDLLKPDSYNLQIYFEKDGDQQNTNVAVRFHTLVFIAEAVFVFLSRVQKCVFLFSVVRVHEKRGLWRGFRSTVEGGQHTDL